MSDGRSSLNREVISHLESTRTAMLDRFLELARIPSVSTDPSYSSGMAQARNLLLERFREIGLSGVQTLEAGGHGAVFGEWASAPGRPTVLVYGHYDVQPPDPIEGWRSPPFEPEIRDGRVYGRGVSDDKGPLSIALETIAAFLHVDSGLPVNVKVLLEGEEEIGSPTLPALVRRYADLLAADAVLSADGASWRTDLPTVNVGSRGSAGCELTVRTAGKDLHSGRFGGGVPNALHVMAELIAGLHAPDGGVSVPGFYDGSHPPGEEQRRALEAIPFDDRAFLAVAGTVPRGEPAYTTLERLWLRPCLDVNGMWGGYTGPGGKTVIPHEAHAKLTIRLVAGQDPVHVLARVKAFLAERCPEGSELTFGAERGSSSAYDLPGDHPLLAAVESSLADVYGQAVHRVRIGGTLPVADIVRRELGVDTVTCSFSFADEDFHAPDEFFRLSSFDVGCRVWTGVLQRLGDLEPSRFADYRRGRRTT